MAAKGGLSVCEAAAWVTTRKKRGLSVCEAAAWVTTWKERGLACPVDMQNVTKLRSATGFLTGRTLGVRNVTNRAAAVGFVALCRPAKETWRRRRTQVRGLSL